MNLFSDAKRQSILSAAKTQFSLYGFRRTSMEDIAKEAGMSRASLYSYFDNKEEIFRGLSLALHDEMLGNAERILTNEETTEALEVRVEGALLAYIGKLHELLAASPHGSELMDENDRLCGEVAMLYTSRFEAMLASALTAAARAETIDLKAAELTPSTAAELIRLAVYGFKHGAENQDAFCDQLRKFVRVFFAGLRRR